MVMEGKGLNIYMWGIMDLTILIKNNACKLFSHFKRSSLHHSFRTLVNTLDALVWSVFILNELKGVYLSIYATTSL